ncbi:ABCF3 [Scenedesmus sp. PABB004]|nr:ABCF3 [Scenedesmus sp. PABB004]
MAAADVRGIVHDVLGACGDETILEYVVGVLEDEHYEHGDDGADTYDHLGPLLLESGACADEPAAREACRQLAARLDAAAGAAPAPAARTALAGGPVLLADADDRVLLTAADELKSGRDLIQTPFGNLPTISDKDRAKLERARVREEAAARAAFEAHQREAAAALAGHKPTIQRNMGGGGARDIHLENFCVSNGGRELVVDASVSLAAGRRYGLIGRNGTGKTTFLRALAGGEIKGLPPGCQVLHVEQEVTGDDTTVLQAVLECDSERAELLAEEARLMATLGVDKRGDAAGAPGLEGALAGLAVKGGSGGAAQGQQDQQAQAQQEQQQQEQQQEQQHAQQSAAEATASARLSAVWRRLVEIDADGAEARAAAILSGLSFDAAMMARPTSTFSGGWRMRVALARALFVEPDLLLLDEPTNHLDLHAVLWLESYLLRWPHTLLVVSHAREFLNAVCTDVLHLHARSITCYKGNYDVFVKTAAERLRNAQKAAEAQAAKRAHVQGFIDKFRFNAKRASLVQSRIKALERMAEVEVTEVDPEYLFTFPDPGAPPSPPLLGFHDVDFGYPGGPLLFRGLNFGLDLESRAAIVGPNGIGKSTLLGLIAGTLQPLRGHITRNPAVRLAVFSQHHVDGLDLARSALALMLAAYPGLKEQEARAHLGSFGLSGPLALQPLYTLSGGQKSRVALAKLTYTRPHILLLDEPSNHLDIDAVDALIQGLALFKGGLLAVSHDQYLIESTVDELWMCEGGAVTPWRGTSGGAPPARPAARAAAAGLRLVSLERTPFATGAGGPCARRRGMSGEEGSSKVVIVFSAAGGAPILKADKVKISADSRFSKVVAFLRKQLHSEAVFVYLRNAFCPALDEELGVLARAYGTADGKLHRERGQRRRAAAAAAAAASAAAAAAERGGGARQRPGSPRRRGAALGAARGPPTMSAPPAGGACGELLTALQDQLDAVSRRFFEAVGVLQRDAPPRATAGEALLAAPPAPDFKLPDAVADMSAELVAQVQATQELLALLPDDLGAAPDRGGARFDAEVRALQAQHAAVAEELAAAVEEAEGTLALLQGLYAALARAKLAARPAAAEQQHAAAAGAADGRPPVLADALDIGSSFIKPHAPPAAKASAARPPGAPWVLQLPLGAHAASITAGPRPTDLFVCTVRWLVHSSIYHVDLATNTTARVHRDDSADPLPVNGCAYDAEAHAVWASGSITGLVRIFYLTPPGEGPFTVRRSVDVQLVAPQGCRPMAPCPFLLNEITLGEGTAFVTDSFRPVVYALPRDVSAVTSRAQPRVVELPLGPGFVCGGLCMAPLSEKANGIAVLDNSTLLVAHWGNGNVYRVRLAPGPRVVDVTELALPKQQHGGKVWADGLAVAGPRTAWLASNFGSAVLRLDLDEGAGGVTVGCIIAPQAYDVPTNIALAGGRLWVANSHYLRCPPLLADCSRQTYEVIGVRPEDVCGGA